jgi:hypothetical protein
MRLALLITFYCIYNLLQAQTNVELPYSLLEIENPVIHGNVKSINQKVYDCKKTGKIDKLRTDRESNLDFYFSVDGKLLKYVDHVRYPGSTQTIDFYWNDSIVVTLKRDTTLISKSHFEYFNGQLNKLTYKYTTREAYFLFYYDSIGNIKQSLYYSDGKPSQMEIYEHVPDSFIVIRKIYFPDTLTYRRTYKYTFNDHKQLIQLFEFEGNYHDLKEFRYDSLGNLLCINHVNAIISQTWLERFEYLLDARGNWIEKRYISLPPKEFIKKKDYNPRKIVKREITYFD